MGAYSGFEDPSLHCQYSPIPDESRETNTMPGGRDTAEQELLLRFTPSVPP